MGGQAWASTPSLKLTFELVPTADCPPHVHVHHAIWTGAECTKAEEGGLGLLCLPEWVTTRHLISHSQTRLVSPAPCFSGLGTWTGWQIIGYHSLHNCMSWLLIILPHPSCLSIYTSLLLGQFLWRTLIHMYSFIQSFHLPFKVELLLSPIGNLSGKRTQKHREI